MSRDKPIVTRTTRHWLQADGILRSTALPGAGQSLADAHEAVAQLEVLSPGKRRPLLVDLRSLRQPIDRQAREYYNGPETARVLTALALLVGSPASRVVGNFLISISPHRVPTRLFSKEAEALAWLGRFVD